MRRMLAIIGALVLLTHGAQAQTRSEIPIKETVLSNNLRLYSIPITIGGTTIEAGLDTGSAGIRVLPDTLAAGDVKILERAADANFSSGVRYQGDVVSGRITLGELSVPMKLEAVRTVSCAPGHPNCPATRIPPSDYGVRGDSLTGGRFRAIFGIRDMDEALDNPLTALGVKRWIVELPRSGETGRLILNPTDAELADYVRLPRLSNPPIGMHDALNGCIANTKVKICGALLMDSGAPNIRVTGKLRGQRDDGDAWKSGAAAALIFSDNNGPRALENVVIDQPEQGSNIRFEDDRSLVIFAGTAPYLAFDVLYEPSKNQIGLKPRPATADSPTASLVAPQK